MADDQKLKVFLSYSRKDSTDFADELVAGLELAGFAPLLDRHDIAAGEDWEKRLGGLISAADTVVYVISPEAVKSDRCAWEVDKTLTLSKRLIPVIYESVSEVDIPERLRRLQFIRFDTGIGITRPLAQLAEALRQDLDWIREHTRIAELAARWEARGRPESRLLRGDDLDAAKAWAAARKSEAPKISDLQQTFLRASDVVESAHVAEKRAARKRTQRMRALLGVFFIVIVVGLGYVIWSNQNYLRMRLIMMSENVWPKILTAESEHALKPRDMFNECAQCPQMVVLPVGEFIMGSNDSEDEKPIHRVVIKKQFAVSRYELTFDDWDICIAHGVCRYYPGDQGWGRGTRPVINVSWDDVQQYVGWLSNKTRKPYRLLSEAEWEYAARAGTNTAYNWGDDIGKGRANCDGCGSQWDNKQTAPVGSFAANAFGLYDMHGNVWEWVQDCFASNYDEATTEPAPRINGDCPRRVLRGGAWGTGPWNLRSAGRFGYSSPHIRSSTFGFRVARELAPEW